MPYKAPAPTSYWDAPTEDQLVSFEDQLMNTPADLSPLDTPETITSTPPISKQIIQNNAGGERDRQGIASRAGNRDMTNNFGYMNKPGWMGAASMVPGPLGLAAKAANLGVNANNQSAVSGARKTLGLSEQSNWDQAKGFVRDNKGIVSDNARINDQDYAVGFEAMTPDNRTTLTPNEALNRSNLLGGIQETPRTPSDTTATSGVSNAFSSIFDEASSALSSIFGDTGSNRPTEHLDMNMGISSAERMRSFPSAPAGKAKEADPRKTAGPWGGAGNVGLGKTGFGHEGTSGQSVGPSGGGKSWGGPH